MNTNLVLAVVLFLLMALFAGYRGIKAYISLVVNFLIICMVVMLIWRGYDPVVVAIVACGIISVICLFFINGYNIKTITTLVATSLVIVIMILFISSIGVVNLIQGFSIDEVDEYIGLELNVNIDYGKVTIAYIVIGLIGAVVDASISIASAMYEIKHTITNISRKKLFVSGLNIGKDIVCTTVNTIYFASFAVFLPAFIWIKVSNWSFLEILNSQLFCESIITLALSVISAVLIIPITALLACYFYFKDDTTKTLQRNLTTEVENENGWNQYSFK